MFMGPLEATKPWDMNGVSGVRKFLDRSWRLIVDADAEGMTLHPSVQDVEPTADQLRVLHQTIGKVTADTETLSFNTAIARMMEFVNYFTPQTVRPKSVMEPFVLLLSPYAPHLAEELWSALGHTQTLAYEPWPAYRADLAAESAVEIPVQINGKTKTVLSLPIDATKEQIESAARADEKVLAALGGKEPTKVIVVEKGATKLVSFVVK
jgi:leucyl-tRNA synthetase